MLLVWLAVSCQHNPLVKSCMKVMSVCTCVCVVRVNSVLCEQVVSEYRKARAVMADVAAENAPEGVWHNLFQEVDKVSWACNFWSCPLLHC